MSKIYKSLLSFITFLCLINVAYAIDFNSGTTTIKMYMYDKSGKPEINIGEIKAKNISEGLLIIPDLTSLPPGIHGFHIHENSNCDNFGKAAGDHYDPKETGHHLGPVSTSGHKGDLPFLIINSEGKADPQHPVLAPHLTVKDIVGRSIVIHAGGDNYSDTPLPLGGGGARIACGIIK